MLYRIERKKKKFFFHLLKCGIRVIFSVSKKKKERKYFDILRSYFLSNIYIYLLELTSACKRINKDGCYEFVTTKTDTLSTDKKSILV